MIPLGVVVALRTEARCLVRGPFPPDKPVHTLEGLIVKLSGLGPGQAHMAAEELLSRGASALLSWGCSGGLSPSVLPGDLILPKTVISSEQAPFHSHTPWHQALYDLLKGSTHPHPGPIIQSLHVIRNKEEKSVLFENSGAIAVDMESVPVAQVAARAGIPFMAIRVVLDPWNMGLPDPALSGTDEYGRLLPLRFMKTLIRRPQDLVELVRLARYHHMALKTLSAVMGIAGPGFMVPQYP